MKPHPETLEETRDTFVEEIVQKHIPNFKAFARNHNPAYLKPPHGSYVPMHRLYRLRSDGLEGVEQERLCDFTARIIDSFYHPGDGRGFFCISGITWHPFMVWVPSQWFGDKNEHNRIKQLIERAALDVFVVPGAMSLVCRAILQLSADKVLPPQWEGPITLENGWHKD